MPFFPAPGDHPLRCVMLSGDWIPLSLPDAVRGVFRRARVRSLGGATEAAIWSNSFEVGAIDPRWSSVPYGRPIQNCRYHVLDRRLKPVPVGVAGDLYIGGACLAEGYLNRPELTAERFIADPFCSEPGARLYETGDLARYFEDGELEFLGRSDFQVKIRGYRVELPEIEAALAALPGVREAVCTAYVDASGQRALVAYVVSDGCITLDEGALKQQLRARLPEFMVPPVVMQLDAMPLSSNHKLDRKALPSPLARRASAEPVAPRTPLEAQLVTIWERVLERSSIGVHDDFFALGGHSLLAVMLMSELQRALQCRVALSAILECPTVALLAVRLAADGGRHDASLLVELRAGGPRAIFFIHDGEGETLLYRRLAQALPRHYGVYGIKPPARPGMPIARACLRELAARYIIELRRVQPHGPYSFAGLCAGGVIAFEMAHQLHLVGEETDLLVMLDAVAPSTPARRFLEARRKLKRSYLRVRPLLFAPRTSDPPPPMASVVRMRERRSPARKLQNVAAALVQSAGNALRYELAANTAERSIAQRFARLREAVQTDGAWPSELPPLSARQIYEQLRDAYQPRRTPIRRPVLVKAHGGEGADEAARLQVDCPTLGWDAYIDGPGPLQVFEAPGGHSSMLQNGSGRFVARVLSQLMAAEDSTPPVPRARVSVLVVTVSYKTAALVERSLLALAREAASDPRIELRAYVVDNASGDAPQLRAAVERHGLGDWVTIAEAPINGGFAYGNNEGFRHAYASGAPPDYFLMLNPDAEVKPGAIGALSSFLERHPEAAIAGSQLIFDDGNPWPYAFRFPSIWSEIEEGLSFRPSTWLLRERIVRRRMGEHAEAVDWLPGASMMVRRQAIEELGGLDERYFLYFEELDFCLKLQRAGWRCFYVPESRVMHIGGQSSGITDRKRKAAALPAYWYESRRRFFAKNHGILYAAATDAAAFGAHVLGRWKRRLAGKAEDNIQDWLADFARHSIIKPHNQDVLPPLEFELPG